MNFITISEQFQKIKENWLIAVIVVVVLFLTLGGSLFKLSNFGLSASEKIGSPYSRDAGGASYSSQGYNTEYYSTNNDFAPDIKERKITKQTDITTEVQRGAFKQAESKVMNIISSSSSYLLNQNVNKYGDEKKSYYVGSYTLKVDTSKYDSVVAQLKEIGEVNYFRESQQDITGSYKNLDIEIQAEKSRLDRYNQLSKESMQVEQKIQLTDKIFEQERKIKYLEDSLSNMDRKVEYSTIILTINEKRSDYVDVVFIKISELIKSFVNSINVLLKFIFSVVPWAVAFFILRFLYNIIKNRR